MKVFGADGLDARPGRGRGSLAQAPRVRDALAAGARGDNQDARGRGGHRAVLRLLADALRLAGDAAVQRFRRADRGPRDDTPADLEPHAVPQDIRGAVHRRRGRRVAVPAGHPPHAPARQRSAGDIGRLWHSRVHGAAARRARSPATTGSSRSARTARTGTTRKTIASIALAHSRRRSWRRRLPRSWR